MFIMISSVVKEIVCDEACGYMYLDGNCYGLY